MNHENHNPNNIRRDLLLSFFVGIPIVMLAIYLIVVIANEFNF